MTQPKFKDGQKVKTAAGASGVIRQVNPSGTAALVDVGEGDTFETSWYATDSLSKPSTRSKKSEEVEDSTPDDTEDEESDDTDDSESDSDSGEDA